jgi:hypothetical protein
LTTRLRDLAHDRGPTASPQPGRLR